MPSKNSWAKNNPVGVSLETQRWVLVRVVLTQWAWVTILTKDAGWIFFIQVVGKNIYVTRL